LNYQETVSIVLITWREYRGL